MKLLKENFDLMSQGRVNDMDLSKMLPFYKNMSTDIKIQRERIGGNFAIAQAVISQEMRDEIRKVLPDCIFVCLSLTKETQMKRITARHGSGEASEGIVKMMNDIHGMYDKPTESEKDAFNIDITEEMSQDDVLKNVMKTLKDNNLL